MSSIISNKSSLFETSSLPQSSEQWKLALQGVKLLYVQRQYKQCAARSSEILNTARKIHPVYKTYLYFYSAISYEEMGRAAHTYSSNKIALLNTALDYFVTCSAVLPSEIPVPGNGSGNSSPASLVDLSTSSDFSDSPSPVPVGCLVSSITHIIDKSIDCLDEDPFISVSDNDACVDTALPLPYNLPQDDTEKGRLIPSPLQVRKPSVDLGLAAQDVLNGEQITTTRTRMATGHVDQPARSRRPPPLPIKVVPFGATKNDQSKLDSKMNSEKALCHRKKELVSINEQDITPMTPFRAASIKHYNSSIRFLRSQINSSISDIHKLIDEITELQSVRKASKSIRRSASFWSFSPIKEASHSEEKFNSSKRVITQETKEQRIARLRAEGWNTVGLKSRVRGWKGAEYYRAYSSSVLDELYLDS